MSQAIQSHPKISYRPDIDGLRSIAVVSVVAYHAGLEWLSGGYAGVDVFFVISGYLITSLVLTAQLEHRFSLRDFYIRRARRLFPALFAVLATSALLSWWLLMPGEMEDFGESLATAAAFSSNFMFWSEAGYFEGPSEFKPLLHTWSLAVEEQYYLLFPLLLLACRKSGRYLLVLSLVLLTSLVLSQWYVSRSPAASFFLLPHRLWELMLGSLLSVIVLLKPEWLDKLSHSTRELIGALGIVLIAMTIFGYSSSTPFPGISALPPTLGAAALIIAGSGQGSTTSRLLSSRGFVAIGLISYSLYLWHWPLLVFTKLYFIEPLTLAQTLIAVAGSFVMGWLSWRYIERPFRSPAYKDKKTASTQTRKALLTDARVLPASAAIIATFIAFGVALDQTEGAPSRLPEEVIGIARIAEDKPPERKRCTGVPASEVSLDRLCKIGTKTAAPDFIVWGDSHAMTVVPQFHDLADTTNRLGINATSNGCAPLLGAWRPGDDAPRKCAQFNDAVLKLIQQTPTLRTVILAGRWGVYAQGTRYKYESGSDLLLVDELTPKPFDHSNLKSNADVWTRSISRTVNALLTTNVQIVIIDSVPEIGWDTPNVMARARWLNRELNIAPTVAEFNSRQQAVRSTLLALAQQTPERLDTLKPADALCNQNLCNFSRNNQPLYIDEDHLSSAGAETIRSVLRKALAH